MRLFPDDLQAQQDYINTVHDHGGVRIARTVGWRPSCNCGGDLTKPATVMDIFAGAGTVGVVCAQEGRDFAGIEINPPYVAMATERIKAQEAKCAQANLPDSSVA
jgi:tRNA/tmRNA/rRNA uracil-C5-methylase (TrmA/RlmC/RlmD family)